MIHLIQIHLISLVISGVLSIVMYIEENYKTAMFCSLVSGMCLMSLINLIIK